ncbi:MAG: hypothetical protein MO853_10175 [Candidatus Protistobacter heckmanni]|nr:hypothetical protein [Candidatus Protistobacter heckmanni]
MNANQSPQLSGPSTFSFSDDFETASVSNTICDLNNTNVGGSVNSAVITTGDAFKGQDMLRLTSAFNSQYGLAYYNNAFSSSGKVDVTLSMSATKT